MARLGDGPSGARSRDGPVERGSGGAAPAGRYGTPQRTQGPYQKRLSKKVLSVQVRAIMLKALRWLANC